MVQSAVAMIPIPKGEFFQDSAFIKFAKAPKVTTNSLYLRATIDSDAHLILDAQVNSLKALTLVNSGAIGVFMHPTFAKQCKAVVRCKVTPREVRVIDGRVISLGLITHQAQVELVIGSHTEMLLADITNTSRYACILDTSWLICHNPTIRWSPRMVLFESLYCRHNCLDQQFQEIPVAHRLKGREGGQRPLVNELRSLGIARAWMMQAERVVEDSTAD